MQADFLRFYQIGPGNPLQMEDLDGPTFFSLATRASAYGGVMAARIEAQQGTTTRHAGSHRDEVREVESTPAALHAELGDLFEIPEAR